MVRHNNNRGVGIMGGLLETIENSLFLGKHVSVKHLCEQ